MTFGRLLRANLRYHWRGNLAVLLGVAVGCAVLTGALLVGDSLRGSLRELTRERLGWVDEAMVSGRFVRASLADGLPAERVAPAILLRATAERDGRTVHKVTLLGVDDRFGLDAPPSFFGRGGAAEVVLSPVVARELEAGPGDTIALRLQRPGDVPRESPLAQRDEEETISELSLTVVKVLEDHDAGARFNLQPSPEAPRNAFVPLSMLQTQLRRRDQVNALFVGGPREGLHETFNRRLGLEDWGLTLFTPARRAQALIDRYAHKPGAARPAKPAERLRGNEWQQFEGRRRPRFAEVSLRGIRHERENVLEREEIAAYYRREHPYLSLESRELLIDGDASRAALEVAREQGLTAAPTMVYLAKLSAEGRTVAGVVAALDPSLEAPLGFGKGQALKPGEILLADWSGRPGLIAEEWAKQPTLLPLKAGAEVTLTFKAPERREERLPDRSKPFRFAGTVPLAGVAADPDLTPQFPGVTDKPNPNEWKLPFDDPADPAWGKKTIRAEYGDPYWYEYHFTPKAYIRLDDGRDLWANRFGDLTGIRLAPPKGVSPDDAAERFDAALTEKLRQGSHAPGFESVKAQALQASVGYADFAALFLGFSSFLIAAALLLVALLFRLNLERRAPEVGALLAVGYRQSAVRRLLLAEGAVVALLGVAVGLGLALGYAALLLQFLGAIWPGGVLRSFLRPHFGQSGLSLLLGGGGALLVSLLTVAFALYGLARLPPRALLAGQTGGDTAALPGRVRWSWWVAGISFALAAVLLGVAPLLHDHEARAGTFFGSGALLLTAAMAAVSGWMRSSRHRTVEGRGVWSVARLGVRNAARDPGRSLLTVGLLAAAAFVLVAVEAFRRHADLDVTSPDSGSGGFNLLAESDRPLDPGFASTPAALDRLLTNLERRWRPQIKDAAPQPIVDRRRKDAEALLRQVKVFPVRVKSGDDASCLNLYQPTRPRLLGVTDALIDRGHFQFAGVAGKRENPWDLLRQPLPDDERGQPMLPAFGESNTVAWVLHKGLGGNVEVPSANPKEPAERTLRIDGLLQDSVFQSGLILSEANFLELYPGHDGYTMFLIQAPAGQEAKVKAYLQDGVPGLEVTKTADRLEEYLAVENTYLTTFQALGGLGLLLGSLGLAVVLLRGVWERRGELALLRALGWRRRTLAWLVLAENGFLLLVGLVAGMLTAVAAVAPHLASGAGAVPLGRLLGLLGVVLVVALASAALAVASTLRAPLVPALRRE
jgi:ABC-type lipoprotein release transport system permease subunit